MRSVKSTGRADGDSVPPVSSKNNRIIATWLTDRDLLIVGASRVPDGPVPLPSLPRIGVAVTSKQQRRGMLRHPPHLRALKGKAVDYGVEIRHESYRVHLEPRYNRRGGVIGVRGTLSLTGDNRVGDHRYKDDPDQDDLPRLTTITRRRHRNSVRAAIRSLELAKSMADVARANAEIRKERATLAQHKAQEAQVRAEQEERRARFLLEAGAVLDASFDQHQTLTSLGRLITLRVADWTTLHLVEDNRLKRVAAGHRDETMLPLLEEVFPLDEVFGPLLAGFHTTGGKPRPELLATVTPEDTFALFRPESRRRRFGELSVQSMIRTPILSHGRLAGLLMIGSVDPGLLYDPHDLQMARDLAARIARARESALLYQEAQREIAMRKEIESRMRVLNAELERRVMDRTRLLEEATREANSFAYTVAHDLRAPLRAITGFCQALNEDYSGALDAMGQDYVQRIVTGARRMDDLIRDLLDYARINRAEIQRTFVELDQVVDDALHQMAADLRDRQATVQVDKPLGRALAHGPVLVQVLVNLISNAAKFIPPGVRPVVQIRREARGNQVRLLIQDNGIGIAAEHHERIFGIFERLNRAEDYPGTGIGLAIVRRAMERLGGTVGVESQPNSGATFWVELPSD
jgi:signal transduction histidine kinase